MSPRRRGLGTVGLLAALLSLQPLSAYGPSPRIKHIRELAKTDSQAIPELAQDSKDPDIDVRSEAVRAIVKIGTERSLEPLVAATHDADPDIQIMATDGLVNFYLPGYISTGILSHPISRGVKHVKSIFAVRNRQEIGDEITVRPSVQQGIADEIAHAGAVDVRTNAARAAGILHAADALPPLQEALRSRQTQLVLESLYALQKIGDPTAGPSVNFLVRDFDEKVQLAALETVGALRNTSSAPEVRQIFQRPRNDKTGRAALGTLALFALPEDRELFRQNATNSDENMRSAALEGLGRLREPEDMPLLNSAFDEKGAPWRVHIAAAFALVSEGKVETAEFSPLRFLVENLDATSRDNTAQAYLKELCRREDVRKGIYTLLPQASIDQQVELCKALGASGAPDAITTLQDLTKNANSDISLAATKSLRIAQARHP